MITTAIFDVDGTLTDHRVLYIDGPDGGKRARFFDIRDGQGISRLKQAGIVVWIISGESDAHIFDRVEKLDIECALGVGDKLEVLSRMGIPGENIAYMGDDTNDLEAMAFCRLVGCPSDASLDVRKHVFGRGGYLSLKVGGNGAVAEFCDYILGANRVTAENHDGEGDENGTQSVR